MACLLSFTLHRTHRDLPSFPTRRSSDLDARSLVGRVVEVGGRFEADLRRRRQERAVDRGHRRWVEPPDRHGAGGAVQGRPGGDRKSTRLNSSHPSISYAVFCLKKKKKKK